MAESTTCRIYVAAHKPYRFADAPEYVPLQVGAALNEAFLPTRDDTGENISCKNRTFCELTGLYWIWKNAQAETLGLMHYRRYFAARRGRGDPWSRILPPQRLAELMETCDIILPRKRHYVIETNASQYAHAHHGEDLEKTRALLAERCPEFVAAYDRVMRRRSGHRFNMLIMKRPVLNEYCAWLFPLLFELERRIDISDYDAYDRRVFGFIGERLLDVWLETSQHRFRELPVLDMEPVDWLQKGGRFILRKLRGKRV